MYIGRKASVQKELALSSYVKSAEKTNCTKTFHNSKRGQVRKSGNPHKKGKVKMHTIQKGQVEVCLGTGFFQKKPVPKQKLTAFVYCKYCQNMVVLISNRRQSGNRTN